MILNSIPVYLDKSFFLFKIKDINEEHIIASVKSYPDKRKLEVTLRATPLILDFIHSKPDRDEYMPIFDSKLTVYDKCGNIVSVMNYYRCGMYDIVYEFSHIDFDPCNQGVFISFTLKYTSFRYDKVERK